MSAGTVADVWAQGEAYESYIGRWSRLVSGSFLDWIEAPSGARWLDVGCGTGALSETVVERCAPASVVGVDPSEGFLASARERLGSRAEFRVAGASSLPLDDDAVDATVSGLVLNFVPDPAVGVTEMRRVTVPGGIVAAYVWDYAGKMELLRHFWDAATAIDPQAHALDEGERFPICHEGSLGDLFATAGLDAVEVRAIDVDTIFGGFEEYWAPFLGGQGPAPTYVASLEPAQRDTLRDRIRASLPTRDDGSIALVARAWGVRSCVPG